MTEAEYGCLIGQLLVVIWMSGHLCATIMRLTRYHGDQWLPFRNGDRKDFKQTAPLTSMCVCPVCVPVCVCVCVCVCVGGCGQDMFVVGWVEDILWVGIGVGELSQHIT